VTFTVKVSGTSSLRVSRAGWQAAAREWAGLVGPLAKTALQAKAPVSPNHGGTLKKSIRYRTKVLATRAEITFTAVDYARFVIDGTAAHDIRPKNAKALFWEGAQHPVAVVHHPGTKPNDFVQRALEPLRPAIQAALREAMAAALKP
jgi:hypothetical protein